MKLVELMELLELNSSDLVTENTNLNSLGKRNLPKFQFK
jgi:hypothetical protein